MRFFLYIMVLVSSLGVSTTAGAEEQTGYLGVLFARDAANLAVEVSGTVKEVYVRLGDRVEAGQLLARMDVPELAPEIAQAEASYGAIKAEVGKYEAELDDVRAQLERRKQAPDVFSEDEIRALETRKAVAEANLKMTEANARQRRASLDELVRKKDLLEIRAPFPGSIAACYVNSGEFVSVGAQVIRLLSANELWARFAVPEEEAAWLAVGKIVAITPDGKMAPAWRAEIRQISPEIDASIGIVIAEAALTEMPEDERLPIGAVVRIWRKNE